MSAPQGFPYPQQPSAIALWPTDMAQLRAGLPAGVDPGSAEAPHIAELSHRAAELLDRRVQLMLQLSIGQRVAPFAWPASSAVLRDARLFPDTFTQATGPVSPGGLNLAGAAAPELLAVSVQAADVLDERARNLAAVRSRMNAAPSPAAAPGYGAPPAPPAPPTPSVPPVAPVPPAPAMQPGAPWPTAAAASPTTTSTATESRPPKSGIQVFLLVAGIVLISAAVMFFVTVAFREMNDVARAIVIAGLGVLALATSIAFAKTLRITAEGLTWLGLVVLAIDAVYLTRDTLLGGPVDPSIVWGLGLLIVAAIAAVHCWRTHLVAGGLFAAATTAAALGITTAGALNAAPDYLQATVPWAVVALTLIGALRLPNTAQRVISSSIALAGGFALNIAALVQLASNDVFSADGVAPALVSAAISLVTWAILVVATRPAGGTQPGTIRFLTVSGAWFAVATLPALFAGGASDLAYFIAPAWLAIFTTVLLLTVRRNQTLTRGWRVFFIVLTALTAAAAFMSSLALTGRSLVELARATARISSPATAQWTVAQWTSIATYTVALLALLTILATVILRAQPRPHHAWVWVPLTFGALGAIFAALLLGSPAWTTLGLILIAVIAAAWDSSLDDAPSREPGPSGTDNSDGARLRGQQHAVALTLTIVTLVALALAYATSFSSVTLWPFAAIITVLGGAWFARSRLGANAPAAVQVIISALIVLFAFGALRHVGPWLEDVLGRPATWPASISTLVVLLLAVAALAALAHARPHRFARGEALTLFIVIAVLAGIETFDRAVDGGATTLDGWFALAALAALACVFVTVGRTRPLRVPFEATLAAAGFTQWLLAMFADAPRPVDLPTVIAGAALLTRGVLDMRADARLRSWPVLALGMVFVFVPSFFVGLADPELWRAVTLGMVALAVMVAGLVLKWQAPLVVGGTMLILHSITQLWPYIRDSYADFWYVWLAVVGAALVLLAAFYERSLRNIKAGVTRLRDLR